MERKQYHIDVVIAREKERFEGKRRACEEKLAAYPRGSIMLRETNGHRYCYFRYREGKRVITKYAGTEKKLGELKRQIAEREKLTEELKRLDEEIGRMEKMENVR